MRRAGGLQGQGSLSPDVSSSPSLPGPSDLERPLRGDGSGYDGHRTQFTPREVKVIEAIVQRTSDATEAAFLDLFEAYNAVLQEEEIDSNRDAVIYRFLLWLGNEEGTSWRDKWAGWVRQRHGLGQRAERRATMSDPDEPNKRSLSPSDASTDTSESSGPVFAPSGRTGIEGLSILESSGSDEEWQARAEAALKKVMTPAPGTLRALRTSLRKPDKGGQTGTTRKDLRFTIPRRVNFEEDLESYRSQQRYSSSRSASRIRTPASNSSRSYVGKLHSDDYASEASEINSPIGSRSAGPALPFPRSGSQRTPSSRSQVYSETPSASISSERHFAQRLMPLTTQVHSPPASAEIRKLWQADAFRSASLTAKALDRWISSTSRLRNHVLPAAEAHDRLIVIRYLASWRSTLERVKVRNPECARDFARRQCLALAFDKWRGTVGGYQAYAIALQTEKTRTLGPLLAFWRERSLHQRKVQKKHALLTLSNNHVDRWNHSRMKMLFTIWRERSWDVRAQAFDETRLLRTDFSKWWSKIRQIMRLQRALSKIESREAQQIFREGLLRWRTKTSLLLREKETKSHVALSQGLRSLRLWRSMALQSRQASLTYNGTIVKAAYTSWRLRSAKCQYLQRIEARYMTLKRDNMLQVSFLSWKSERISRDAIRNQNTSLVARVFEQWKAHYKYIVLDLGGAADGQRAISDGGTLRKILEIWKNRSHGQSDLCQRADAFEYQSGVRKALLVWQNHSADLKRARSIASRFQTLRIKTRIFKAWLRTADHNSKIKHFTQHIVVSQKLTIWQIKQHKLQAMRDQAAGFASRRRAAVLQLAFETWIRKQESCEIMHSRAVRHHAKSVRSSYWDRWTTFSEYLNNLNQLAESCIYISSKVVMRRCFTAWSRRTELDRSLRELESSFTASRSLALLSNFWDAWNARIRMKGLQPLVLQIQARNDLDTKRSILERWKESSYALMILSRRKDKLQRDVVETWRQKVKLSALMTQVEDRHNHQLMQQTFVRWVRTAVTHTSRRDLNLHSASSLMVKVMVLNHWKRKKCNLEAYSASADTFLRKRLFFQSLDAWYERFTETTQYETRLSAYAKGKSLSMLKTTLSHWRTQVALNANAEIAAQAFRSDALCYYALKRWLETLRSEASGGVSTYNVKENAQHLPDAGIASLHYSNLLKSKYLYRWLQALRIWQQKHALADRIAIKSKFNIDHSIRFLAFQRWQRHSLARSQRREQFAQEKAHFLRTLEIKFLRSKLRSLASRSLARWRQSTREPNLEDAEFIYDRTLLVEGWKLWRHRVERRSGIESLNTIDRLARTVDASERPPHLPSDVGHHNRERLGTRPSASKAAQTEFRPTPQPSYQEKIARHLLLRRTFRTWRRRQVTATAPPKDRYTFQSREASRVDHPLQSARRQRLSQLNLQLRTAPAQRALVFE